MAGALAESDRRRAVCAKVGTAAQRGRRKLQTVGIYTRRRHKTSCTKPLDVGMYTVCQGNARREAALLSSFGYRLDLCRIQTGIRLGSEA